jgi:hypothetical protein
MDPTVIAAVITGIASIGAAFVAYWRGKEGRKSIASSTNANMLAGNIQNSGIIGVFPDLFCDEFEEMMRSPGNKKFLNTWFFNLEALIPKFRESLKYADTTIEINILDRDSTYILNRANELRKWDGLKAIDANLDILCLFLASLSEPQRTRVKVYKYDHPPKFALYSCNDRAFVGFFWINKHSMNGPQFLIGTKGFFAESFWEYYKSIPKVDITELLLKRKPN